MKYTVYQITNTINGKIYIGVHKERSKNDTYMGSGVFLKQAQIKYGIEHFTKEILFRFETRDEMLNKERELVNEEFIARDDTYNMILGGGGGSQHLAEVREKMSKAATGRILDQATRDKISNAHKGQTLTDEHREKISKGGLGLKRKQETKDKIAAARTGTKRDQSTIDACRAAFLNTPNLTCPHCGKECKPSPFKRWHGDNCRSK